MASSKLFDAAVSEIVAALIAHGVRFCGSHPELPVVAIWVASPELVGARVTTGNIWLYADDDAIVLVCPQPILKSVLREQLDAEVTVAARTYRWFRRAVW